ncbi:MAG: peptide chain release factor N(5)-glutamine methyltransferase [Sphingomonadales bacterium]
MTHRARMTVAAALDHATKELRSAGVPTARIDAQVLFQHATGRTREDNLRGFDKPLEPGHFEKFTALIGRRARREPVSQIIGEREFWSLPFQVTADTLTPRPDSETVIEAVLAELDVSRFPRQTPFNILDLGTGTGCLLLSLLHELGDATGMGVDADAGALAVARQNARSLELAGRASFVNADWNESDDKGMAGVFEAAPFDIVISNPPYIRDGEIDKLDPEVACFEPRLALAGGADGLDAYRAIGALLPGLVRGGGMVAFEVGAGQAADVECILQATGANKLRRWSDLAGFDRCITAKNR